jgi:hypothetical protein
LLLLDQIKINFVGNVNSCSGHKPIDWLFEGITFFAGCQAPQGAPRGSSGNGCSRALPELRGILGIRGPHARVKTPRPKKGNWQAATSSYLRLRGLLGRVERQNPPSGRSRGLPRAPGRQWRALGARLSIPAARCSGFEWAGRGILFVVALPCL